MKNFKLFERGKKKDKKKLMNIGMALMLVGSLSACTLNNSNTTYTSATDKEDGSFFYGENYTENADDMTYKFGDRQDGNEIIKNDGTVFRVSKTISYDELQDIINSDAKTYTIERKYDDGSVIRVDVDTDDIKRQYNESLKYCYDNQKGLDVNDKKRDVTILKPIIKPDLFFTKDKTKNDELKIEIESWIPLDRYGNLLQGENQDLYDMNANIDGSTLYESKEALNRIYAHIIEDKEAKVQFNDNIVGGIVLLFAASAVGVGIYKLDDKIKRI